MVLFARRVIAYPNFWYSFEGVSKMRERGFAWMAMLFMASSLYAREINLVLITNDCDRLPTYFYLRLDKHGDIREFGRKDLDTSGRIINRVAFENLNIAEVVLKRERGRKVVVMRGNNVGPVYGGHLELDYLYNGITHKRKSFSMKLVRDNDKWKIYSNNRPLSHLHFKVHRKRLIGVIGIKRVQIVK